MFRSLFDWRLVLVFTHRWLGIVGCVLFATWFASGIVMMYARMPTIAAEEQLARAATLDLSGIRISPAEAAEIAGGRGNFEVGMLNNRPVYRFAGFGGQTTIFADTGDIFDGLNFRDATEVARRYAPGHDGPIRYDRYVTEPDQWTLQADRSMPMHRLALDDEADTYLYVSEVTGDVELRTTRRDRFWAYLGPVTHWVYFTPFRRTGAPWGQFIIWSSLIGCAMCISGLLWGLVRFSPARRFRLPGGAARSPYDGLMKWHHYAGLLFGLVTLTWTYSGLLSMQPFGWFERSGTTRVERDAATGGPLRAELLTLDSMRAAAAAFEHAFTPKTLGVMQFQGTPYWVAERPLQPEEAALWVSSSLRPRAARPRSERLYVSSVRPEEGPFARFDRDTMMDIAVAAVPGVPMEDAVWLDDYDGYYYDAQGARSLPVLRVRYTDADRTWLYLDPARGDIVQQSEQTGRLNRWLYQGFHSLDFPALYFKRPLWDVVVIGLSLGGLALSVTTMLPAWRRLRRHARTIGRFLFSAPN